MNHPRPLPLETETVYGPIVSRRLGVSLGINVLPKTRKLCSFDCVYCHYGRTDCLTMTPSATDFPTVHEVVRALTSALRGPMRLDTLTFSGTGEPTLHPYFGEIVFEVQRLRDRFCPAARIALFSNSTTLARSEVSAALGQIDLPILKLDAGDVRTFRRVNRPDAAVDFKAILEGLRSTPNLVLQSVLIAGSVTNADETAFEAWMATVKQIRPTQVQIYSTDYPVASPDVQRVPAYRLRELAELAEQRIGVPVHPFWFT